MLHKLRVDISFILEAMTWNDVTMDMKPPTCTREDAFHVEEELFVLDETDRVAKTLNAKYKHLSQMNNNQQEKNTRIARQAT